MSAKERKIERNLKTRKKKRKKGLKAPPLLTSHDEPVPALVPRPRRPVRLVVPLREGLAGREAA